MPTSREVRLSRRDETLVDLLIETGLSRNIAKTLVFLSKRDETTSVEIEKATGLRQPEVSIAMQELRRREWLVAVRSQFELGPERLERRGRVLPAERMDLDGQRRLRAETTDEFGVVDDYNELLRRGGHDLLAEQGAAHPFDQVEFRVDFVR